MAKRVKKKPVVILYDGVRYVMAVPCPHCHGGVNRVYDRTSPNLPGRCHRCQDGLVDTPLAKVMKKHFGIIDELPGSWRGKPIYTSPISPNLPRLDHLEGTLHFYPEDSASRGYWRGLCGQGLLVGTALSESTLGRGSNKHCPNCERIKGLRESGKPVVYESQE